MFEKRVLAVGRLHPPGLKSRVLEMEFEQDGKVVKDVFMIRLGKTAEEAWGYLDGVVLE